MNQSLSHHNCLRCLVSSIGDTVTNVFWTLAKPRIWTVGFKILVNLVKYLVLGLCLVLKYSFKGANNLYNHFVYRDPQEPQNSCSTTTKNTNQSTSAYPISNPVTIPAYQPYVQVSSMDSIWSQIPRFAPGTSLPNIVHKFNPNGQATGIFLNETILIYADILKSIINNNRKVKTNEGSAIFEMPKPMTITLSNGEKVNTFGGKYHTDKGTFDYVFYKI